MTDQNRWFSSYPSWLELKKVIDFSYCMWLGWLTTFSFTQQHSWQLWSPAVADEQRSRSADQLSPKWQATAEFIHLEAPGTAHFHPAHVSDEVFFFQRQRNEVSLTTRAGKVKRVSLVMLRRKSAKRHWRVGKLKPVWWLFGFTQAASDIYRVPLESTVQLMKVRLL